MALMQRLQGPFSLPDYSVDTHSVSRSCLGSISKFSHFFKGTASTRWISHGSEIYCCSEAKQPALARGRLLAAALAATEAFQLRNSVLARPEPCKMVYFRNSWKHLQVSQACLAHSRGNGLDGCQHGVDQLGEFTGRTLGLAARFHDEPGQGPYVRVEGRLVRHTGAGCWTESGMRELCPSRALFIPTNMRASQGIYLWVQQCGRLDRGCNWARGCRVSARQTGLLPFSSHFFQHVCEWHKRKLLSLFTTHKHDKTQSKNYSYLYSVKCLKKSLKLKYFCSDTKMLLICNILH